jgi:GntR family transcriptional regulator
MTELTRAKPLPIYLQISELLTRQIRAGFWRQGERLPTEADLAQSLNVAVGTLRKSLALLEEQGVLERIQGSGTYVRGGRSGKGIYDLFRLELHDGPGLPTASILSVDKVEQPGSVPLMNAAEGASGKVWRVRRLRLLNAKACAIEEIFFDARHTASLKATDLGDSMYLFYQTEFGLWVSRAEDHIFAAPVPSWSVPDFKPAVGRIVGYIERTSWTAANEIAEFSKTWFDPAVCRYASRLKD